LGTVTNVGELSREEFDALEFEAARTGDHLSAASRMLELAQTGVQTPSMPRAEAFLRAGEQWLLADRPAEAAAGFRRALEDGGPVFADPRVPLARALYMLGQAGEAQALIDELKAEERTDPRTCDLVAELLVECGDLESALDWATAGVEACLHRGQAGNPAAPAGAPAGHLAAGASGPDREELRLLLNLRYRIRNDLGLPEDSYDALAGG
jgi:hypothetical protein